MTSKRYIELNSTYRNRTLYSNPSNYQVLLSDTVAGNNPNPFTAKDPIILSYPFLTGISFTGTTGTFGGGTPSAPKLSGGVTGAGSNNWYTGILLKDTTLNQTSLITNYDGPSQIATLENTFGSAWASTDGYSVLNPSTSSSIFLPNATYIDNFYIGDIIEDATIGQFSTITDYDSTTSLLTVSPAFSGGWAATDYYNFRYSKPIVQGSGSNGLRIGNAYTFPASVSSATFTGGSYSNPKISVALVGNYVGMLITDTTIGFTTKIIEYVSGVLTVTPSFPLNWAVGDTLAITAPIANTYAVLALPNVQLSGVVDQYVGNYFSDMGQTGINPNNLNLITGYVPNVTATQALLYFTTPFTSPYPATGDYVDILQFTRDNYVPLNYSGSTVSQQEEVCYEIELISLMLPNVPLEYAGIIAFYPFVSVKFDIVSKPRRNIIYSNDPTLNSVLFTCAIDNSADPTVYKFIKITGNSMVQTVKFKSNDSLQITIYLPNGTIFTTFQSDNLSPLPPNPLLQNSIVFSVKRL